MPVAAGLVAGSAHRQIARTLGCAPSTVTRLSARLGRHAMLVQALALEELAGSLAEPLAADHFETFEFTQDFPFGVLTLVGRDSWFVYGLDPAPHGRTGHRSAAQEARRLARPGRSVRGAYRGSFDRGLDLVERLLPGSGTAVIACDGKSDYVQAHRRHVASGRVALAIFPNPKRGPRGSPRSAEARARDEALHPVDQLHALLRHSRADHKRETIAFGRRLNAVMERLFVAILWRNFIKGRSERKPDPATPAMRLGLAAAPWTWRRALSRRLFRTRLGLPRAWDELYRRAWTTPLLRTNLRHDLRQAM